MNNTRALVAIALAAIVVLATACPNAPFNDVETSINDTGGGGPGISVPGLPPELQPGGQSGHGDGGDGGSEGEGEGDGNEGDGNEGEGDGNEGEGDGSGPVEPAPPPPATTSSGSLTAPLRRLTQEELNHTLRDLFVGIPLSAAALDDGQGRGFEGDVDRQVPSDFTVEQLRAAALAVAARAIEHKDALLPRQPTSALSDQRAVGHELIDALAPRAFRRPLVAEETAAYAALFDQTFDPLANSTDAQVSTMAFDVAVQATIEALLLSPAFVYRVELGDDDGDAPEGALALTPYELASRLSYLVWGSMPDDALFEAARTDQLRTPDQIEAQARRMLLDDRARDAARSFHRQWLDFDAVLTQSRDPNTYPSWNDQLKQSIRTEADALVEEVMFGSGEGKLRALFTSTTTRVDAPLAALYGVAAPATDWELVQLPGTQRSGVLTLAAFLASRAHAVFPSPVLRGVFVLDRFLCMAPPAPTAAVDTTPPEPDSQQEATTNRSRYAQHTSDPFCQGCHVAIDGVGFGLEGYDAIGAYRTMDNGFPVDDSGTLEGLGVGPAFQGAPALAEWLGESELVEQCAARQWLTWMRGRKEDGVDWPVVAETSAAFAAADGDIRELLVAITKTAAFRFLPVREVTP